VGIIAVFIMTHAIAISAGVKFIHVAYPPED